MRFTAAVVCLLAAAFAPLCKAVTTITITGTTYSSTTDGYGNVFVSTNTSTNIGGLPFTLTITLDKTQGTSSTSNCSGTDYYTQTVGPTSGNGSTAILTINGIPFQIGGGVLGQTSGSWNAAQWAAIACSGYSSGEVGYSVYATYSSGGFSGTSGFGAACCSVLVYPATGVSFSSAYDWQSTLFPKGTKSDSLHAFSFYITYTSGGGTTSHNVTGYLQPEFITITGQQPVGIAKTLGNHKTVTGCGGQDGDAPNGSAKTATGSQSQKGFDITYVAPILGCDGTAFIGDPINVATGNVFEEAEDYSTSGQNPLAFRRYYNSMASPNGTFASMLGVGWRTNYDRYLHIYPASSPSQVVAERPDGQGLTFNLVSSTWTPDSDVEFTLTKSGSTWTLTGRDDTVETYTDQSNGEATLQTITYRNGYELTMNYTSGVLTSVSDSYSRSLGFNYTSGLLTKLTTPDSPSTGITFAYTASLAGGADDQLSTVTYPTATATTVTYNYGNSSFPYALTSITDENSNTYATWGYDSSGRATSNYMGGSGLSANSITVSYSSGSATVTNAYSVADTYTFTTYQGVPKVTSISRASTGTTASASRTLGYDGNGYLDDVKDWNGNETKYTNNGHGMPTSITQAYGSGVARTITITYDSTFVHQPDCIATANRTTAFTYNMDGTVNTRTESDTASGGSSCATSGSHTRTWTYAYTSSAPLYLVKSVTGPRTDVTQTTSLTYNTTSAYPYIATITDPIGNVTTSNTTTAGGLPTKITDANSVVTNLTYDGRQRILTSAMTVTGGTLTTTWTYDSAGNLTQYELPDSSYLAYTYDNAHRVTKVTNANSEYIQYTLDQLGDKTETDTYSATPTLVRKETATFDALGRQLTDKTWSASGTGIGTVTYAYDSNGNSTSIEDALTNYTYPYYDALNRVNQITDRNSGNTYFTYDDQDQTLTVKDPNANTTTYTRNGFEFVTQVSSPDSGTSTYTVDLGGNATKKVDGASIETDMTYDKNDRQLTRTFPADTTQNIGFTYDQSGTISGFNFGFGVGRMTTMTDAAGTIKYQFDERGNDLNESRNYGGTVTTKSATYDNASRILTIVNPSGYTDKWIRDAMGQVKEVAYLAPSSGTTVPVVGSSSGYITHLPFGPALSLPFQNGVTRTVTYDTDYRPTEIKDNGTSVILDLLYGYDANNNVTGITDNVNAANGQTLTYDVLDRLKKGVSGTGGYGTYQWTYDANGNRSTEDNNGTTATYGYTSGTNILASISTGSYTYGANGAGAMTTITASSVLQETLAYSQEQQLNSVTTPGMPPTTVATYVFDGFNDRFLKSATVGTGFKYSMPNGALMEEANGVGQTTDYLYLDPSNPSEAFYPVAMIGLSTSGMTTTETTYYIHADNIGTPQYATDSGQTVQWSATYLPFGATVTTSGSITQNLRLPGMYYDSETGFYNNGYRTFDPAMGRYHQSDPIGLAAGTANTYAYANNNPSKFLDVTGLQGAEVPEEGPEPEVGQPFSQPDPANPVEQLTNQTYREVKGPVDLVQEWADLIKDSKELQELLHPTNGDPYNWRNALHDAVNPRDKECHVSQAYITNTKPPSVSIPADSPVNPRIWSYGKQPLHTRTQARGPHPVIVYVIQ